ncbi:hypothetical protein SAMN05216417_106213 [Nitrosospira multiformis]|uniref:Uncharacterized protein n=1 Tax=Nitrosospira multiformis TaxID=1231 RepID=A0A1I7H2Q0_9PROT|nr:hypothetical protein SAMN05216417_106213 [Nitrosospira multiformis]
MMNVGKTISNIRVNLRPLYLEIAINIEKHLQLSKRPLGHMVES